jgi:hypothetical protein
MTLPRKQLVVVEDMPYYPIVSRCYRCGIDAHSGKNYACFCSSTTAPALF